MIENECKHIWRISSNIRDKDDSTKYICTKCQMPMQASEVFQLEILNKQNTTLIIAIIAVIISGLAFIVSALKVF
jgi:hypothetical protein